MNNLIEIQLDDESKIYLETRETYVKSDDGNLFTQVATKNKIIEKGKDFLDNSFNQIKAFSSKIANSIKSLDTVPDEIEVEFLVNFTADAGIIISSVSSQAGIAIKLKWTKLRKE